MQTTLKQNRDLIGQSLDLTPIIPLKDIVVFPTMSMSLCIGRAQSLKAIELAIQRKTEVLLLSQKNPQDEEATGDNLYHIGTLAKIVQVLPLPNGTQRLFLESRVRAKAVQISNTNGYLSSEVEVLETKNDLKKTEMEALKRELHQQFIEYTKLTQKIDEDTHNTILAIDEVERFCDTLTTHIVVELKARQAILEATSLKKRMTRTLSEISSEIEILNVERKIQGRIKQQIEKNQKDYYLQEQAKAIQQELGSEDEMSDIHELEAQIKKAKLPKDVLTKANAELRKLKSMPQMSSESAIIQTYIEHLVALPWNKTSKVDTNLTKAQATLDKDHYGLDKVKERIVEYLAVENRTKNNKSPILCLVGAPGVGKTSLGESIAKATGRKYIRMALGGLHDEAEIRGHRKTYIGAMAGKILQNISRSGVKNPLFLLDEIDKLGSDHRGDPASALLEVLDPEQNKAFVDNYTEVPFDLSGVMFIATANSLNIPEALRDRMEILRLSGYTEQEKLQITQNYIIPKQIKNVGLKPSEIHFDDDSILNIIRGYSAEAGVRNLARLINKICRKVVKKIDTGIIKKEHITSINLKDYLGVQVYDYDLKAEFNRIGRVTGLAWTEFGGDTLTIEVVAIPGKGQIIKTGKLGEVMQESIQTALSLVRSKYNHIGIDEKFYETNDIHVHVPEGATPKDGPSAGIAMALAIASSLNHIPIKADLAMTGEVTLYGEVLPIGGLKEKLLAALRARIKTVLIPHKNIKDLEDVPVEVINQLEIIPVKNIDEVFVYGLESNLTKPNLGQVYTPVDAIPNTASKAVIN